MGRADYLDLGDYNAVCSMCGFKRKASQLVKNWQGEWRCPEHNEPRQPQDYVRAVPDNQVPGWTQPDPGSIGVVLECTLQGNSCVADWAVADCATCDNVPSGLWVAGDTELAEEQDDTILFELEQTTLGIDV